MERSGDPQTCRSPPGRGLRAAETEKRALDAAALVDDLVTLREDALDLLHCARREGDQRGRAQAMREVRADIELFARLGGLIDRSGSRITLGVQIGVEPDDSKRFALLQRILADPDLAKLAQGAAIAPFRSTQLNGDHHPRTDH